MKHLIIIIMLVAVASGIAIAERQERFQCLNDDGMECECVYDKRTERLIINCLDGRDRNLQRSRQREAAMDRSSIASDKRFKRFGLSSHKQGHL